MTKREKILLVAAIIILILLFGVKNVIMPTVESISALNKNIQDSQHQLRKTKLELSGKDKYSLKLRETMRQNSQIESLFYHSSLENARIDVLKFLDAEVNRLALEIDSKEFLFEVVSQEEGTSLYRLIYRAQIKGDYQQFLSLLETINTYKKFYSIKQLDLQTSNDESQLSATVVIESYCIDNEGNKSKL